MMSELVRETPLTPFEEMEAEYRELPKRLSKKQNFYEQPPFDPVLKKMEEKSGEAWENLGVLLSFIPEWIKRLPQYRGAIPEEIDIEGQRATVFDQALKDVRVDFGKNSGVKREKRRKIARELLEALDSFPFWMTYVDKHTSSQGAYRRNGELKCVAGAKPGQTYLAWVREKLERKKRIRRLEVRVAAGEEFPEV